MEAPWSRGTPARCPFTVYFLGEGSPTKIDYRKKGTLILTSLLADLDNVGPCLLWGSPPLKQSEQSWGS